MEVFECGTNVNLKIGNGYGMITAVKIAFDSVTYEITTSHDVIVRKHEREFKVDSEKVKIGYKKK